MKPSPLPSIEGARVVLRPFSDEFVSAEYLAWLKDDETTRWLVKAGPGVGLNDIRGFCHEMMASPDDCFFAILDKATGMHVGNVRVGTIDWRAKTSRFGMMIGAPDARGRGLGTEVMALVEAFAFEALGLDELCFPVVSANEAAMRMYARRGFVERGAWAGERFVKDGREWPLVALAKRKSP